MIALVVPVLNEARELSRLGDELVRAARRCEVVVVDGGSTDGTCALLAGLDGVRVIHAPRGRARQMNAGARATRSPILLFLHADTRLPAEAPFAIEAAIAGGAVGGCFGVRIDSADPRLWLAARIMSWRSRLIASATGDQAIFARRDVFTALGGYRELPLFEDLDLVARLGARGRFVCADGEVVTSARRWQQSGVARTIAKMWALRLGYHLGIDPGRLAGFYEQAR